MALTPEQIRRGVIVLVRLPDDKSRPAVIVRADILADLSYATISPLTTELRPDIDFRIVVEPTGRAARDLANHGRLATDSARQNNGGGNRPAR
jgi:mRNA-degrading endonuclease toxin of MazEF toxin-antitoxin module